jgi:hypothetical protein
MNKKKGYLYYSFGIIVSLLWYCAPEDKTTEMQHIRVSGNERFLTDENGEPFFWLGDTGWLLLNKLNREETTRYLADRKAKGFNVIQVMVLHTVSAKNAYGDSALIQKNVAQPLTTDGTSFKDSAAYDFWDHVDFVIEKAEENQLYLALVPVWGSNVKAGHVKNDEAKVYAKFLADRYKNKKNVIWLNGGDIKGSDSIRIWETIGNTLKENDANHLVTFHPRGRTQSSTWFHAETWLDFNMIQSGHRRYDQDTSSAELRYGEDNWRYVTVDYHKDPVKPTLDAEPSYEGIPQGLHDTTQPVWIDKDVRRYAYWSVFAGACGYTYGHNSVMQMLKKDDTSSAYGAKDLWHDALDAPGATQMVHLKKLMLSRPYFNRVPDQTLVSTNGEGYNYQVATRGETYAFIYSYNGKSISAALGKLRGSEVKASWYDPRNGKTETIGTFENKGVHEFDPPGDPQDGNDWILIIDSI